MTTATTIIRRRSDPIQGAIVGWGHTPFGKLSGQSLEQLIIAAAREALDDAGIDGAAIDAVWLGHFNAGMVADAFCSSMILDTPAVTRALSGASYQSEESDLSFPAIFARYAMAYQERCGDPTEAMARIADAMQVPGAELGLCFNMGGGAVASCVSVLEPIKA